MIASVTGHLVDRQGDAVVLETDGGVGYAVAVSAGTLERLPPTGHRVTLFTHLVVREDEWALFGFDEPAERGIFQRLLLAGGVGPKLALAVLSALGPERTVRSIQTRDLAALATVPGVGRKKAERMVLELQDRFQDLVVAPAARAAGTDEAVRALVALGYTPAAADDAVHTAVAAGAPEDTAQLIRRALQHLAATRGGRQAR